MKVRIANYSVVNMYGRNVVCATMYDMDGTIIKTMRLAHLLDTIEEHGYELVNSYDVLRTIVMQYGFTA